MKTKSFAISAWVLLAAMHLSIAGSIDLTTAGASGSLNGGFFQQVPSQSTGTGTINPFVRFEGASSGDAFEEGYNATVRPVMPDVKTDPNFTKDIQLSAVPIVTLSGVDYYQFLLDINEAGGNKSFISLFELQIWTSSSPLATAASYADLVNGATMVWDLDNGSDGDSTIELKASLNTGSGSGDMFAYIPTLSVGRDDSKYLYLYSAFGTPQQSDAGFEEWAVLTPGPRNRVPDGGATLASLGFALLGLGSLRKLLAAKI